MTNTPPGGAAGGGPPNAFSHAAELLDGEFKTVVRPNFDTVRAAPRGRAARRAGPACGPARPTRRQALRPAACRPPTPPRAAYAKGGGRRPAGGSMAACQHAGMRPRPHKPYPPLCAAAPPPALLQRVAGPIKGPRHRVRPRRARPLLPAPHVRRLDRRLRQPRLPHHRQPRRPLRRRAAGLGRRAAAGRAADRRADAARLGHRAHAGGAAGGGGVGEAWTHWARGEMGGGQDGVAHRASGGGAWASDARERACTPRRPSSRGAASVGCHAPAVAQNLCRLRRPPGPAENRRSTAPTTCPPCARCRRASAPRP
jgi:hypothetical protein